MAHPITIATCSLNQWALDFDGNHQRILQSIKLAKEASASIRVGPELEISGYGCFDHFLEADTVTHSWEVLAKLLASPETLDILCDVGMPVIHRGVLYNCRVLFYNSKIILVRPKMWMANDGNYRELRYFSSWRQDRKIEQLLLPRELRLITAQTSVPIGLAIIVTDDTSIGIETCEELFTPNSPHIQLSLEGVEIFLNSSASHHELRKLHTRIELIEEATEKAGGVYVYANQQGCDGDRIYYDGCSLISLNGKLISQGSQFSLKDVEVIVTTVDLETVRTHRVGRNSRNQQAALNIAPLGPYERVYLTADLTRHPPPIAVGQPIPAIYHTPEEEIALGPACWLWDYLRRSGMKGYFVPLSGGIDSCATATIVYSMCTLVAKEARLGNQQVIDDAVRITSERPDYVPLDPQEFCNKIFHTCYMGTENSSPETRKRAKDLASAIGSYHTDLNMDAVVTAIRTLFAVTTGKTPLFKIHGGTQTENLALQNIQARLRMLLSYMFAQLSPWVRGTNGGLLVLGSANVDESLRGYMTKYDCSSADINPIGGISKTDLKRFIAYAQTKFDLPILEQFLTAVPTAELEPITTDYVQADEVDMGMTYDELSIYGRLRKVEKCGPYSMFRRLVQDWNSFLSPIEIAGKVKHFFFEYAKNRHKMTTLTPSYHAETYSPDDNRFDLRPFLYPVKFDWQFRKIDQEAEAMPDESLKLKAKVE
ncbi:glutamine-dependent NAD(+) synthetase [Puccinia graminis f. sp. tritici]|uniref:Glutamine-dependent NAD(+) synthetase n=3 Tax=Puccinia graminis f. sp. tritici TaxID=56615 RepID=E3JRH7_PUCGT|nr:glutamine-dependent NAD(+) synthetase [Puccinia graminis f. sp. tritici CRL 75-36-700-3]EFP74450.1 glutamine-dependent NAD(+) synthetase [Puccinia graminis f. sp. tritici CRL 75-36-700-3]KAA1106159.1 glutamine-dependent NAD(+) synthetase [Puccinia graminis f. sp. tritici]KAA1109211.1 glutamine-dependent NAD(+) synthetase [Puccinia graminis f. sp. tritici]KAA1127285.1 glutamine-dependent NAD(+) synthetase [Puccinia graminis f. sp. tritici]